MGKIWRRGALSKLKETRRWFEMLCLAEVRIEADGAVKLA
jgi:hypothetical protein